MSDQGPAQGGVVLTGGHGSGQPLDTVRTEVGDVEETVGTGSWRDTGCQWVIYYWYIYLESQSPPLWTGSPSSGKGPARCWRIPSKVFLTRVRW